MGINFVIALPRAPPWSQLWSGGQGGGGGGGEGTLGHLTSFQPPSFPRFPDLEHISATSCKLQESCPLDMVPLIGNNSLSLRATHQGPSPTEDPFIKKGTIQP